MKKDDPVDTTAIILELLNDIVQRLEGLDGNYGKPSKPPRNGSNVTALVLVTLLLGILLGAVITLLVSGCDFRPALSLGVVGSSYLLNLAPKKAAQIKLVRGELFSMMLDKNNTIEPVEQSAARKLLSELGYVKIKEEKENGYTTETWELPEHKRLPC